MYSKPQKISYKTNIFNKKFNKMTSNQIFKNQMKKSLKITLFLIKCKN